MKAEKIRQAYLTLTKAVHDKPIDKVKTPRKQIVQIDNSAQYIRSLQDIACYLGVLQ